MKFPVWVYLFASVLALFSTRAYAAPTSIAFAPCAENAAVQCGSLRVPIDYRARDRGEIALAVIRAPATDSKKRIGVLFVNNGGPGFSGVDFILQGLRAPIVERLRERFDIVSFDPRGAGRSEAVRCDIGPPLHPHKGDPAQLPELLDAFGERIARACHDQNGPLVGSMSTNNIARDVETLRRALHEKELTYVGLSFGTELGAVYASMFPDRVRAMVLDAGIAPEFHDSYVEFVAEQAAAMERVLRRVDVLCRRDPGCPLARIGVVTALDRVIDALNRTPVAANGVALDGDNVRDVVSAALYFEHEWPTLVRNLASALHGDYSSMSARLPHAITSTKRATNTKVFDSYDVILCSDFGTRRKALQVLDLDATSGAAYPRLFGKWFLAGEVMRCSRWPAADTPVIRDVSAQLHQRIFLIGNDFDPATPLSWTRSLARALGVEQNVVIYEGGGHGALTAGIPCVDDLLIGFVVDNNVRPTPGFRCAARPLKFSQSDPGTQ